MPTKDIEGVFKDVLGEIDDRLEHLMNLKPESRPQSLLDILHEINDQYPTWLGCNGGSLLKRENGHYKVIKQFGDTPTMRTGSSRRTSSIPLEELAEDRVIYRYDEPHTPRFLKNKTLIALGDNAEYIIGLRQKTHFRHHDFSKGIIRHLAKISRVAMEKGAKYQGHKEGRQEAENHLEDFIRELNQLLPDPEKLPNFEHMDTCFYIQPLTQFGKEQRGVSGDHLYIKQVEGKMVVGIIDGKGHGVKAARYCLDIHKYLELGYSLKPNSRPDKLLTAISESFTGQAGWTAGDFASMLLLQISNKGVVQYANAGHLRPLVLREGELIELTEGDGLIGYHDDFKSYRFQLQDGDGLYAFTDGVTEAFKGGEAYGLDRLKKVILEHQDCDAQDVVKAVLTSVRRFTGQDEDTHKWDDDFTFFATHYNPSK